MNTANLQVQLAKAEATIRALHDELNETNRGLVALNLELDSRVEQRTAELAKANEALRQSEQRYRLLFDRNPDGVFAVDAAGRFILANPACESVCGYPLAELLKKSFADLCAPDKLARTLAQFEHNVRDQTYSQLETALIRKDGRRVEVWIAGEPIVSDGQVIAVHCTAKDITDRKRAEEELNAAKDSAEQAKAAAEQANRTKDHFLAVLSHELRTPLTPVVMGVSMLQDRPDLDPSMRETLEMVRRNVEMEARLIDDLLDVTRIARGKIELHRHPVELCTVIHRAIEVCKPDIEARRLHFGVDLGLAAPYWVEADVARLQQVFWNLLKNAIKFTPHGGCVGIRCRPDNDHVSVEVNDSGIGMEPEALPRVFNAFEQVERSITRQFGGLGLGLAISKALVEMHGGKIEAHSEGRDKGATFRVWLPLTARAGQPETPMPAAPPRRVVRPLRILLVEDHGVTAKMMKMVLTAEGHTVETAGDVATGLELADQQAFDLLLSDLGLPDGSGHDLMRGPRSRGHKFPGIALSG
jgi:two-component system, chemotaxis family, CheB/CheR fusion protein